MAENRLLKAVRTPFYLVVVAFSVLMTMPFFGSVTVGAWIEDGLRTVGWQDPPGILLALLGVLAYLVVGLALPILAGARLLGPLGAVAALLLVLALIAYLGRW
ncbi:MAG: hypothetical protein GYB64_19155 [Chloroflexi bacterium]|nr:hypothetical protein [Chloroflexota bacterium]